MNNPKPQPRASPTAWLAGANQKKETATSWPTTDIGGTNT